VRLFDEIQNKSRQLAERKTSGALAGRRAMSSIVMRLPSAVVERPPA